MPKRPNTKARLRRVMKDRRLSQRQLAPLLGCSQTYISLIMSEQRAGYINRDIEEKLLGLEMAP